MNLKFFLFLILILAFGKIDSRLYYIHIPKTGGSSLRTLLEKKVHVLELYPRRVPARNGLSPPVAQEIVSGHFPISFCEKIDPYFDEAYKFTVLRDPVERYLSYLRYRKRNNTKFTSLENVLQEIKQKDDQSNLLCKFLASDPQASKEELLQSAQENVDRFDFIIFFDRFTQDAQTLCRLIGIEWEEELRLNKTDPEPVSPELLQEVIRLNELDIIFYDYVKNHYLPKPTSYRLFSPFYADLMTRKSSIDYTFHMPLCGSHWCYRENVDAFSLQDPIYRYVMDLPAHIFFCLENEQNYLLEFNAKPIAKDIQPRLKVNDIELKVEKKDYKEFSTYQCALPASLLTEDLTKLTFFSSTAYPYNLLHPSGGNSDQLSFALNRIKIIPNPNTAP